MFLGHALLAFAVAAAVTDRFVAERRLALAVGVVAGAFATLPDVDVAYGVVGTAVWLVETGGGPSPEAFWATTGVVHRSVTHSLVVGAVAAPAFGLLAVRERAWTRLARASGAVVLGGLVAVAFLVGGLLPAAVLALFAVAGAALAVVIGRRTRLSPAVVGLAALWGLWSHPIGDVVTGSPPNWLYPFETPVLASRVVLHPDPTLHLLAAFAIELATIWLALAVYCRLTDRSLGGHVGRRAGLGVAYGVAVLVLTPPTLAVSYQFVFSILGVGVLGGTMLHVPPATRWYRSGGFRSARPLRRVLGIVATALATVTVALGSYATAYVLLG